MIKRYKDTYYIIYDDGRIFNEKLNRFVVQRFDKDGYLVCWMNIDGKRVCVKVHRIVAETFIPNPLNKPQVNHKDLDRSNPSADNLEWAEYDENIKHSFSKSNRHQVVVISTDNDGTDTEYRSISYASKVTGISCKCIRDCLNGIKNRAGGLVWRYKYDNRS